MKKTLIIFLILSITIISLLSISIKPAFALEGPWQAKIEGNGTVSGSTLSSYGVLEADLGWNFRMTNDNRIAGNLNIVEKLENGKVRHFKVKIDEIDADDPTVRPILFNCETGNGDARSVRIEVTMSDGSVIAAHFRDSLHTQFPNTVWYWVKDSSGNFITNTGARLLVSNLFTLKCN